jgi:hypothetical protein
MANNTVHVGTLEVTPEYLVALGQLTILFSDLDRRLMDLFQRVTSLDPISSIAVESHLKSSNARIGLLRDIIGARVDSATDQAKLFLLLGRVEDLTKKRNAIVHYVPYSWNPGKGTVSYVPRNHLTLPKIKKSAWNRVDASAETITQMCSEIWQAIIWLGLYLQYNGADENGPIKQTHDNWNDDEKFPFKNLLDAEISKREDHLAKTRFPPQ